MIYTKVDNSLKFAFLIIGLVVLVGSFLIFKNILDTKNLELSQIQNQNPPISNNKEPLSEKDQWGPDTRSKNYDLVLEVAELSDGKLVQSCLDKEIKISWNEAIYIVDIKTGEKTLLLDTCGLGPLRPPVLSERGDMVYAWYESGEGDVIFNSVISYNPKTKAIMHQDFGAPSLQEVFTKAGQTSTKLYNEVFEGVECWSAYKDLRVMNNGEILVDYMCYFMGNKKYEEVFENRILAKIKLDLESGEWTVNEIYESRIKGLMQYYETL